MTLVAAAVAAALGLDLVVGEPPARLHPVAAFGRVVGPFDRAWTRPRLVGAVAAGALPVLAAVALAGPVWVVARASPVAGAAMAAVVLFVTTTLRMLCRTATEVAAATETDLPAARERLLALAGRDADALSAGQVRSAVVESLAENLADGLVAPLAGFLAGALVGATVGAAPATLALAAGGAAFVKAVNTMDSMLGYRSKPVGWAAAVLDDAVMWIPARASALVLAVVSGSPRALGAARGWLEPVPSPNSGWPMGVTAAALDVRLEKPGVYALNADAALPSVADVRRSVRLVGAAGVASYLLGGVIAWC